MEIYFKITRDFSWQETLQIGNEGRHLIKDLNLFSKFLQSGRNYFRDVFLKNTYQKFIFV